MAAIEVAPLPARLSATELWPELVRLTLDWLEPQALSARDAVVLLPYAALLPHARAAFAARGGWQPRVETTLTLAATLAPPPGAAVGELSGDMVMDRITAAAMLMRQSWALDWNRGDPRGFNHLVARVTEAAQALARAASSQAPSQRPGFWAGMRQQVSLLPGAMLETALLEVAIEWAALAPPVSTDALFTLRPAAWIALRIGGADLLAEAVLAAASCPALLLDADAPQDDPYTAFLQSSQVAEPRRLVCVSVEAEAQACAAEVITAVNSGHTPVALVVLDRVLARRVRALLAHAGASLSDETGWRLSTTAAAARAMATLRAAAPEATADERLAWLKCELQGQSDAPWLLVLEAAWRRARYAGSAAALADATAHWLQISARLQGLTELARAPRGAVSLWQWQQALRNVFGVDPKTAGEDEAKVRSALRLEVADAAWLAVARAVRMSLADFIAWVDDVLDASNLEPPPLSGADVVLTPLARAVGRPFAHVVVPGADELRLGSTSLRPSLISEGLAQRLGLESARSRQLRERAAFAQLLRAPRLSCLRRRFEGDAPLSASPLVNWLAASWAEMRGCAPAAETPWRPATQAAAQTTQPKPLPQAALQLPQWLSASSVAALRECPYRFYARSVLRLSEREEIDAPLDKREYGNWLHLVLHHFHEARAATGAKDDPLHLLHFAQTAAEELRLDAAALLPFMASFEVFVPAYLAWLAAREGSGWAWHRGEIDLQAAPAQLAPQGLAGRLDRIDQGPDGALEVLDYKTGNLGDLKKKVRDPLEDTQLPFYAALVDGAMPHASALLACYLALDDAASPVVVRHDQVADTAVALIAGLSVDFAALRGGAAMPALGEGSVCQTCEARGLCRRDHWAVVRSP